MAHRIQEPIFITKNGYGDMVIMSMETFARMTKDSASEKTIPVRGVSPAAAAGLTMTGLQD